MIADRLTCELTTLPLAEVWTPAQARDLLRGRPELVALYGAAWGPAALANAGAARRRQSWRAEPRAVAAACAAQVPPPGPTPQQQEHLSWLLDPATVVIVAGQQPGLFGGPLYSFYKALTAVVTAARLTAAGQPAVPVFWIASEDDDFEEVASTWLLDNQDAPQHLQWDGQRVAGQAVGRYELPAEALDELLAGLAAACAGRPDLPTVEAALRHDYTGRGLGAAFAAWLQRLLGGHGLLTLDPTTADLRALAGPFLERVLQAPLRPTELANAAGDRLLALGYEVPTHRPAGLCALYWLDDAGLRRRLWLDGPAVITDRGERLDLAALQQIGRDSPARFSTSLLLRPVLQDYLLPTAGFVVGPGEIGYAAQVGPIWDHYEVPRSALLPRFSATLLEPKVAKHLQTYRLTLPQTWEDLPRLVSLVSQAGEGQSTSTLFRVALEQLQEPLIRLQRHAQSIDPSLEGSGAALLSKVQQEVSRLEEKVQRALRQRDETLNRRLAAVHHHLWPGNGLQERRYGLSGYLARYGWGLVDSLREAATAVRADQHAVLRIL
ncbi:MAG: bacillithiol biosynthesis cysteine-adding enzyme BshC [Fimbriimonadaceae bacterium]|nr:bacillithiol biosynthesis cysteine-adding enzyme BshC [Fimbriimonadaceae bacterium]